MQVKELQKQLQQLQDVLVSKNPTSLTALVHAARPSLQDTEQVSLGKERRTLRQGGFRGHAARTTDAAIWDSGHVEGTRDASNDPKASPPAANKGKSIVRFPAHGLVLEQLAPCSVLFLPSASFRLAIIQAYACPIHKDNEMERKLRALQQDYEKIRGQYETRKKAASEKESRSDVRRIKEAEKQLADVRNCFYYLQAHIKLSLSL
jgi:hypothetical protein